MEHFDLYTIKARLSPAIITVAPAIALLVAILNLQSFGATEVWASMGLVVVLYALSHVSREAGLKVQNRVYRDNDGRPTFDPIYYDDRTFSDEAKLRYLAFLSGKLRRPYPTMQQAAADHLTAKQFYNEAATWLREATRDTGQFRIIYDENITYGYFRNLLGLKWVALTLNLAVTVFCLLIIFERVPWFKDAAASLPYVLAVSGIHGLYVLFGVSEARMRNASKRYARQLLLACDTLDIAAAP
ncbi:hypothetical protein ACU8OG_24135 [Rhizobium leguminosarum]